MKRLLHRRKVCSVIEPASTMQSRVPFDPIGMVVEHEEIKWLMEPSKQSQCDVMVIIRSVEGNKRSSGSESVISFGTSRIGEFLFEALPIAK